MFFNHMVLALDGYFCHRARDREGKDANPLNEVRVLCSSLMSGGFVLVAEKSIRLDPASSVLRLEFGDVIQLNAADFRRLSDAFFDEIESRCAVWPGCLGRLRRSAPNMGSNGCYGRGAWPC